MANLRALLAGINWHQHITTAWNHAGAAAATMSAYLAALPRTCVLASAHAALVCRGEPPEYSTPGFGPLAVGWGWLLLGILLGAVFTVAISSIMRKNVSLATLARIAGPPPTLADQVEQPPQDVLSYIAAGGRPALQELSAATGLNESEFLHRVYGCQMPTSPPSIGAVPPQPYMHPPNYAGLMPQPRIPQRIPGTHFIILSCAGAASLGYWIRDMASSDAKELGALLRNPC